MVTCSPLSCAGALTVRFVKMHVHLSDSLIVFFRSGMAMIFDVLSDRIPQEDRINAANSCS